MNDKLRQAYTELVDAQAVRCRCQKALDLAIDKLADAQANYNQLKVKEPEHAAPAVVDDRWTEQ